MPTYSSKCYETGCKEPAVVGFSFCLQHSEARNGLAAGHIDPKICPLCQEDDHPDRMCDPHVIEALIAKRRRDGSNYSCTSCYNPTGPKIDTSMVRARDVSWMCPLDLCMQKNNLCRHCLHTAHSGTCAQNAHATLRAALTYNEYGCCPKCRTVYFKDGGCSAVS